MVAEEASQRQEAIRSSRQELGAEEPGVQPPGERRWAAQ